MGRDDEQLQHHSRNQEREDDQGPGLPPAFSSQSDTNDIEPAYQEFNPVFPIELPPQDQDADQVAGQPATFDETFLTEIGNFLEICGEPTADVSDVLSITEEEFLETYLNIPSVVSAHGGAQEETLQDAPNAEVEPMDFLAVDDYLVPPPPLPQTFSNHLPTPVCPPLSIPVNTDGGVPLVVQVATIPSRSQSVIKQGPVLAARLSTSQAHCRQAMHTTVGRPRGKKVAKTNAERCELYRTRQKSKKEKGEEELRMLDAKNRVLKTNEAAIRKKVQRMKEALLRMGLGNFINQNM